MTSIAHIREKDKEIQTVETHLIEVKKLAEKYGSKIGVGTLCGLAGLLHDMGKYSKDFKEYILRAVYQPDNPPSRGSVDHSTAGGKLLYDLYHTNEDLHSALLAEIVGNAIISHHSYLQDNLNSNLESNYLNRVRDRQISDFEEMKQLFFNNVMNETEFNAYVRKAKNELINFLEKENDKDYARRIMYLTKFIFSTLIDADRTNSRQFEENNYAEINGHNSNLFSIYYEKLMNKLNSFQKGKKVQSLINQLRNSMSEQCDKFAEKPSGIYTLSIPTGGGKTLASLRYALKHAQLFNKKRIIYIVPYTTIIEQNAKEVRKIVEDYNNVLEHHSNVINEDVGGGSDDDYASDQKKLKLAKDNWESPIIFSTMVQFLDIFYGYGGRNIRRLHNLSESIIIFDEVQKVPVHCVSLFNHALNFLKNYCKTSIILCTATQPALDFVKNKLEIRTDAEIINNITEIVESFKRVDIIDKATGSPFNQEELIDFINKKLNVANNALIILNTKKAVKDLYEALLSFNSEIYIYHLSTSMCPSHRVYILEKVKKHLDNNEKVICVSTQLIEAGVDISFECVVRSVAGLDSIAQAAGRCNRHGEKDKQNVYVIDYENENLSRLKEIARGKEISKNILVDIKKDGSAHGGSILSIEAMERYFKEFYLSFETDLDYPIKGMNETMIQLLMADIAENNYLKEYVSSYKKFPPLCVANSYHTAAKNFKVIDSPTTSVIVPYGDGKEIIAELNGDMEIEDVSLLFQKAQQYTVNLYHYQLDMLNESGSLITLFDDKVYAVKEGAYDFEYGVNIEGDSEFHLLAY